MAAMEDRASAGHKLYSPSAARNAGPLAAALGPLLPRSSRVLEVASGTGEHAARLCASRPDVIWQPSDPDAASRASIAAWAEDVPGSGVLSPLDLDVTALGWAAAAGGPYDLLFCANMIHIAPWAATEGLFREAGRALGSPDAPSATGRVALYGPFSRRGAMVDSNRAFDASLKARDPAWGVRDLDDAVQPLAARCGWALARVTEMPANNLFVVFEPN